MPTGSVKTPNSARAKEAASTGNSADHKGGSAGKKLVQTRLPFKLITPVAKGGAGTAATTSTTPTSAAAAVIDLDADEMECLSEADKEREPRKRKLSYDADDSPTDAEQLRRSNSKENLAVDVASITPCKKTKTIESTDEDLVELIDEEEDEKIATPKRSSSKPAAKSIQTAHVQIKLPVKNKRAKRRKSLKKPDAVKETSIVLKERSDSSDDIEAIAEQLNPQKRVKVTVKDKTKSEKKLENEATTQQKVEKTLVTNSDSDPKLEDDAAAEISSTDMEMDVDADDKVANITEDQSEETDKSSGRSASAVAAVSEKPNNLTPKQQKLLEQRRKAREEKERKLQEERNLKQQEKEQREQLKKVEREQKEEQRRKEREDKEQLKRKEREEKERKRQAEVDSKNEEKRKRNEVKEEVQRKKDEERRRKELEKEEAELKKKRAADSFTKFFVPKQPRPSTNGSLEHEQNSSDSGPSQKGSQQLAFRPFQVKDDMILAPVIRATIESDTREQLDSIFYIPDEDDDKLNDSIGRVKRPTRAQLYLGELSRGKHNPLRSKADARLRQRAKDEEEDDDVQVIDELASAGMPILEERPKQLPWMRVKYLHFADNRRPPYYGTWRKSSQLISARRPLGQDKTHFDYEVDSDCEWEEEEPGESLSASEDEKERESEEESEEEYNEWFVPHGHLSDEELQNDDEDGNTREAQKAKLQVLQQEFAQEMKKQTKKIKPRLLGPVWLDENGHKSQLFPAVFTQTIDMYGCWQLQPLTLEPPTEPAREEEPPEPITLQLDEPLLQQLVHLIHGNSNSKAFLISEYLEYLKTHIKSDAATLLPPKTVLREKFDELASWKPIQLTNTESKKPKKPKKRLCWVVNDDILQKFQLAELTLQNQWKYTLTPKTSKADTSLREETPPVDTTEPSSAPKPESSKSGKHEDAPPATVVAPKKRATLLMSVPRDQQFHAPTKNALISQYLRKQKDDANANKSSPAQSPLVSANMNNEIVLLSD